MTMPQLVATLVAEAGQDLPASFIQACLEYLHQSGIANARVNWIADKKAADIFFDSDSVPDLKSLIARENTIDCIIQPAGHRRKKLLLADMESTIIEQEMLDELADTIGLRDKVAAITARAMNGELDFAAALRERVALLRGLPECVLSDVSRRITMMPGAVDLLKSMKANGAKAWLVSGGFTCFAKPVAEALGFDQVFANKLVVQGGIITGEVAEPIVDKNTKKDLLEKASAEYGLSLAYTVTVGDGANDIPMLAACNQGGGLGIAYHAKPNVRAVIPHQINHTDLRTIMYAQGYGA